MSCRCTPCVVIILVTGLIAAVAVAKPEKVVFSNAGNNVNQPCKGGDIDINGASGSYVLTGDCGTVAVNGATNTVYLEAPAKIRVTGAGNKVVWVRGAGKAKKPNIKNTGVGNQLAQGALPGDTVTTGSGSGAVVTGTGSGTAIQVGGVGINVPGIGSGTTGGGPAVAAAGSAAAATEAISLVDNGQQITRACSGQDVSVTGNENQVTLTGDCGNLSVTGNENQITIEATYEISLTGNDNTVVYRRGVKAKKPRLSNLGNDNSVRQSE